MPTLTHSGRPTARRLPIGAELLPGGGTHFRVWAPRAREVAVVLHDDAGRELGSHPLAPEADGYFAGAVADAVAGTRYRFRLDGGAPLPDPASRFQPDGPHGPSEVVDSRFDWSDGDWAGPQAAGAVIYEMHVGTFTREGTWQAAMEHLPALADVGVTLLEVMPIAEFTGRFGWGYDGVDLFAPTRLYGRPGDVRRFVDRAHSLGLGVILDVVYNHVGPDGNYLPAFSDSYFSQRYRTEWGEAFNFDAGGSAPVREFICTNARYWAEEFHFDGLRLDATQSIFDASPRHIITDIREAISRAAHPRRTFVVGENEPQDVQLLGDAESGGCALDALWNDDFHHAARVALTGRREAYFTDYRGSAQEFVSAAKYGFLYQGQWYRWQQKRRGTPTRGIPARRFVHFLENHDQTANSLRGERIHGVASPGRCRAMTALLLLGPQTPMLFQGQEFAASAPFTYFADHGGELASKVREGRWDFVAQFPNVEPAETRATLPDPGDPAVFDRCKLDHAERERHREAVALHRDLIRLRREDEVLRAPGAAGIDGAVLGDDAFLLRWFDGEGDDDRLLVVNLGRALRFDPASEPLLAPPRGARWRTLWSSEALRYGGSGTAPLEQERRMQGEQPADTDPTRALRAPHVWHIPGECAVLLVPDRTNA